MNGLSGFVRMGKRLLAASLLLLATLALGGCGDEYEWNQKLTVTVLTPNGEVSGSAVVNEVVSYGQQWPSGNMVAYKITGEATVVEVAPGKFLFALLSDPGTNELAMHVWGGDLPKSPTGDARDAFRTIQGLRAAREVPREKYPLLVTFADISEPKSVKEAKPGKLSDVFGAGYHLKSITLEITDEAVTEGIRKKVSWMDEDTQLNSFWKSLYASGYRPNGSIEVRTLFIRGK